MDLVIYSLSGLSILLLLGKYLRVKVGFFQRIFLPSSVIAGLIGLIAMQFLLNNNESEMVDSVRNVWSRSPGFLINIVFATLFLGKRIPGLSKIWDIGGVQVVYGQIVGWGQYVIGIGLVLIFLVPLFDVNPMMGALIEIGFEGGHGTAAGLTETFDKLGWSEGKDLAMGSATIGVFFGVLIGMVLINIATRRGKTQVLQDPKTIPADVKEGIPSKEKRESAGILTTSVDSIEPLALHFSIVGVAIFIGFILKQALILFENSALIPMGNSLGYTHPEIMASFPLFPLAMLGGVFIQKLFDKYDKREILNAALMQRLQGIALDFLIVSALATISVQAIWANIIPFSVLMAAGIAWNVLCVFYLAPRLFWDSVFERSIADFGQSMGVTATGLVLLRVVDPKSETVALEAFGYKQLIHEPLLGGGLFTGAALPLIHTWGPLPVLLFAAVVIVFWILFYRIAFYRKRQRHLKVD